MKVRRLPPDDTVTIFTTSRGGQRTNMLFADYQAGIAETDKLEAGCLNRRPEP